MYHSRALSGPCSCSFPEILILTRFEFTHFCKNFVLGYEIEICKILTTLPSFRCYKPLSKRSTKKSHTEPSNTVSGLISSNYYEVGSNSAVFQRTFIDPGLVFCTTWHVGFGCLEELIYSMTRKPVKTQ